MFSTIGLDSGTATLGSDLVSFVSGVIAFAFIVLEMVLISKSLFAIIESCWHVGVTLGSFFGDLGDLGDFCDLGDLGDLGDDNEVSTSSFSFLASAYRSRWVR